MLSVMIVTAVYLQMQDIIEREEMNQFVKPSRQEAKPKKPLPTKGFVVAGAPWDTSSTEDFPSISPSRAPAANGGGFSSAWGKK